MIRLLLDMGLPRQSVGDLQALGWDVAHIGELGRSRETDEGILALAREDPRIVVTHDADFTRLLALSGATRPSVIHLRIPRLTRDLISRLLPQLIGALEVELETGALLSVREGTTRIRRLPLI